MLNVFFCATLFPLLLCFFFSLFGHPQNFGLPNMANAGKSLMRSSRLVTAQLKTSTENLTTPTFVRNKWQKARISPRRANDLKKLALMQYHDNGEKSGWMFLFKCQPTFFIYFICFIFTVRMAGFRKTIQSKYNEIPEGAQKWKEPRQKVFSHSPFLCGETRPRSIPVNCRIFGLQLALRGYKLWAPMKYIILVLIGFCTIPIRHGVAPYHVV